jgi:chromosome partitioning protein
MPKIIAITNQKGGVGKTATASALVSGFAEKGYKVLAIDMDPQGNLGFCFGVDPENALTVYELMKGTANIHKVIVHKGDVDVIPANILLSSGEHEFSNFGREFLLKKSLATIKDNYDYIVIDTPPALNVLTVNAFVTADYLIVPMIPEILSLMGISQLTETANLVKSVYNPNMEVLGILLNKYDGRRLLTREVEEMANQVAVEMNTKVLRTRIRNSVAVAEAPAHGISVYEYSPKSNATKDYRALVDEILSQKGMKVNAKKK